MSEPVTGADLVAESPARYVPAANPVEIVAAQPASQRIMDIPEDQRPRERMIRHGAGVLSDEELLAIFFGTGTKGLSAIALGRLFMRRYRSLRELSRLSIDQLLEQKGIGEAKAVHLAAAFELGRRLAFEEWGQERMDTPEAVTGLLGADMRSEPLEVLKVLLLNTQLGLIGIEELSRGTLNETIAHPRDVMHHVVTRRAYGFTLVHNHPSGDPMPSQADRIFTRRVREAAEIMQVKLIDHIIIGLPAPGKSGYFSFREHHLLA
jgi:DNA repair protein RadC